MLPAGTIEEVTTHVGAGTLAWRSPGSGLPQLPPQLGDANRPGPTPAPQPIQVVEITGAEVLRLRPVCP